jgi:hypothetical protein
MNKDEIDQLHYIARISNLSKESCELLEKAALEITRLQERDDELTRLEEAGVDSWEGY